MNRYLLSSLLLWMLCMMASIQLSAQVPSIEKFTPRTGAPGTTVEISGKGFSAGKNRVFFGTIEAQITRENKEDYIEVKVPAGATYDKIRVLTSGKMTESVFPFSLSSHTVCPLQAGFTGTESVSITAGQLSYLTDGDLDMDGDADLVALDPDTYRILVFSNISKPGSPGIRSIPLVFDLKGTVNFVPTSVAIGDMDGNGKPELVVTGYDSKGNGNILIYANTTTVAGTVSFDNKNPTLVLPAGNQVNTVVIGDLDGDGKPDLATSNPQDNVIAIYRNTSSGVGEHGFDDPIPFVTGEIPRAMIIGDLNRDGMPDLVTANAGSKNLTVHYNGSGGSNFKFSQRTLPLENTPVALAISDLNNDLQADLAVTIISKPSLCLLQNNGDGSFQSPVLLPLESTGNSLRIADIDGNGFADVSLGLAGGEVMIFTNTMKEKGQTIDVKSFDKSYSEKQGSPADAHVVRDIEGDGKPDIITAGDLTLRVLQQKNIVPGASLSSSKQVMCAGEKLVLSFTPSSGMAAPWSFTYSANSVAAPQVTQATAAVSNQTVLPVANTQYQLLTVTDANGCTTRYTDNPSIASVTVNPKPVISPSVLPDGKVGVDYTETSLSVSNLTGAITWSSTAMPPGMSFNTATQKIMSTKPTAAADYTVKFTASNAVCSAIASLKIHIEDLLNPKLTLLDATKTYGDTPFKLSVSSLSKGPIEYSFVNAPVCSSTTIDKNSGVITIGCAQPTTPIQVRAIQTFDPPYRTDTAYAILIIRKAETKLLVERTVFIGTANTFTIPVKKLAPVTIQNPVFTQLSGEGVVADVSVTGVVTPVDTGTFSVRINVAGDNNFLPYAKVFNFAIAENPEIPEAKVDTITIVEGVVTTINILENDQAKTAAINYKRIDIDKENSGIQSKFYITGVATFDVDTLGNLTIAPFTGFYGTKRIGYTITDEDGLTSNVSYIEMTIVAPKEIPPLQGNEVMTPNNDGLNDALVIGYADLSQQNSLYIMDAAGNTIYQSDNYQNDWTGEDNKGRRVEPGVYYYVYTETAGSRELKGFVQIVK